MEEKSGDASIYRNADFLGIVRKYFFRNSYVIVFPFPM